MQKSERERIEILSNQSALFIDFVHDRRSISFISERLTFVSEVFQRMGKYSRREQRRLQEARRQYKQKYMANDIRRTKGPMITPEQTTKLKMALKIKENHQKEGLSRIEPNTSPSGKLSWKGRQKGRAYKLYY